MAESSYMQLLDHGAKVTSDAFNRIDQAMTRTLQVQQRAGEFQTEMTAKAAMFGEQARMNDASIENMKAANYIRGQEFELKKQLLPLQIEEQNLRLQALKEQHATRTEASKFNQFNQMTQAYEPMVKSNVLRTMSPDMANEFGAYRGQWMAHVANGGGFDGAEYKKGLDGIVNKYQHVTPSNKPWNVQDRFLLEQVHPDLGRAYDLMNPQLKAHKNEVAVTMLSVPDNEIDTYLEKNKGILVNDEPALVNGSRSIVQDNNKQIENNLRNISGLYSAHSRAVTPEDRADKEQQINDLNAQNKILRDQNLEIRLNTGRGLFGPQPSAADRNAAKKTAEQQARQDADDRKQKELAEAGERPGRHEPAKAIDPIQVNIHEKVAEVGKALSYDMGEGKEKVKLLDMPGIDLRWFSSNTQMEEPNEATKEMFVNRFSNGVEQAEIHVGDIGKVINKEGFDKLFKLVKGSIEMPVTTYIENSKMSSYYQPGKSKNTEYEREIQSEGQYYPGSIIVGKAPTFGKSLGSYEDVIKLAGEEPNPIIREQLIKDLYAIVAAAATTQAVTKK